MSNVLAQLSSDDEETRRAALSEASSATDDATIQAVIAHVLNETLAETERQFAAECLAKSAHPGIGAAMLPQSQAPQPMLRTLAAIALGGQSTPEVIRALIRGLTDTVNTVRNWSERSLLNQIAAVRQTGVPELLALLAHTVPLSRSPAARVLGQTQDARALPPLMQMAESDPDWLARMAAVRALGDLGRPDSLPRLRKLLTEDAKNRVRAAAAEAIGKLRPSDAESLLRTALETDDDAGVQKSAGEALRSLGFEVDEINDDGWE